MHRKTARDIRRNEKRSREVMARVQTGVVTDDSPFTVSLGDPDNPLVSPKKLKGWTPAVDDDVIVLRWGQAVYVLPFD